MLPFHPLTLADKQWIDEICVLEDSRSADFSFTNMFLWDEKYRQQVCRLGDRLLVMTQSPHGVIFPFPIGGGELAPAVSALMEHARECGFICVLRGVETRHMEQLEALFPDRFISCHDRDYDDYLYSAEKLAALSGKKMHAKRNHINRFESQYSYRFEPMEPRHFSLCLDLLKKWSGAVENGEEYVSDEHRAILRAFENFETLGLAGGCLFVENSLAAFTIGDRLSSDTFNVHFEKASPDFDGAYPMINRCFVRHILELCPDIKYINREDDMGLENIRRAKMSYYPDLMVEKHSAALS